MDSAKFVGMDVHKETISIAVMNSAGKLIMESIIETKAITILQFIQGLRGDLHVTFEEGTWAAWLPSASSPSELRNAALVNHSIGLSVTLGSPGRFSGRDLHIPIAH